MRSNQSFMSFLNKDKATAGKECDRFCCAKCRFSTKDTGLFQRHVAHHKEMTFSCAVCGHVSYSKTESQKHVVSHTGSYPFRCSFCSYGAVRRDYMVKHIRRIHKRHPEKNFVTNFDITSPPCEHQSVTDTHRTSGWPERTEQSMNPSTDCQSKGNAHVEYPTGSQSRTSTSCVTVSKTSSTRVRFTCSTSTQCAANSISAAPAAKTQFMGAIPSCAPKVSNSLGNTLQVLISGQENGKLSSSLVNGNSQSKLSNRKTTETTERFIQKAEFQRVSTGCTEPPLKIPRVNVPEKAIHSKIVPKVQVRLPVEMNSPLRPLLNMPMGALSQRNVAAHNVQTDQRVSQSAAGTNILTAQKMSLAAALPNSPIKHSERSPLLSMLMEQTTEKSNQPRTNSRILIGSSAEKSSPLSNVQVELLAPLNQPIQHNKPLTVSCPEEINIPAGCLVELVEVKNVNGTRELELRLIPPNGIPQDLKGTVDGPSPVATASKLSFKCQVAAGSTASPSKSLTSQKQPPLACTDVQSIRKTLHPVQKPQCSLDTAAQTMNKHNPKSNGPVFRPSMANCEATEVSSEGLPVISSVFSLCPTPTSSLSQFMAEFHNSTLQTNGPLIKLQGESKMDSDPECKMAALKESKENVQGMICSSGIKKEEETQVKHKDEDSGLKETKTEPESVEETTMIEACCQEKTGPGTTQNMFEKCSNTNTSDLKENVKITSPLTPVMPSNKDNILDEDKGNSEYQSGSDFDQHSCRASLMYPKVALVRIPSSLLEPTKKVPETTTQEESSLLEPSKKVPETTTQEESFPSSLLEPTKKVPETTTQEESFPSSLLEPTKKVPETTTQEESFPSSLLEPTKKVPETKTQEASLTARPVLCCTINEQNVSRGPEGAIKLILKRDFLERKDQNRDAPPRKKHKKTKKRKSSSVVIGFHRFSSKGHGELRLTPLKEDQLIKLPGPDQPVVVLNHPNPLVQMVSVGVQTLKNYKWIRSVHHVQEQMEVPTGKQPSLKMKLRKIHGQKYQVIELVLRGVSEKLLS